MRAMEVVTRPPVVPVGRLVSTLRVESLPALHALVEVDGGTHDAAGTGASLPTLGAAAAVSIHCLLLLLLLLAVLGHGVLLHHLLLRRQALLLLLLPRRGFHDLREFGFLRAKSSPPLLGRALSQPIKGKVVEVQMVDLERKERIVAWTILSSRT